MREGQRLPTKSGSGGKVDLSTLPVSVCLPERHSPTEPPKRGKGGENLEEEKKGQGKKTDTREDKP